MAVTIAYFNISLNFCYAITPRRISQYVISILNYNLLYGYLFYIRQVYNTRRRYNSSHRSEAVFRDFNPRPRSSIQRVCGQSQRPFIYTIRSKKYYRTVH